MMATTTDELHSDLESQFEEEREHDEPPIDGDHVPHGEKWSRKKKATVGVVTILAIVLMITLPLVILNNQDDNNSGKKGVSPTNNGGGGDILNNNDFPFDTTVPTNSDTDKEPTTNEETEESTTTTTSETTPTTPTPSPTLAPVVTRTSCPANATTADDEWVQIFTGIVGEDTHDSSGIDTAMNADGTILAISSTQNTERAGHVRVYRYDSSEGEEMTLTQLGQDLDGRQPLDRFGSSIALDGTGLRLAVGGSFRESGEQQQLDDGNSNDAAGHVRVLDYSEDSNEWVQVGQDIEGKYNVIQEVSLSSDGDRLVISASAPPGTPTNSTNVGYVRVYDLIDNTWVQVGEDIASDSNTDKRTVSLSADGKTLAIGAYPFMDFNVNQDVGQVQVYQYEASSKSWLAIGNAIEGKAAHGWGAALSLSATGTRLAIASSEENSSFLPLPGTTRIFELQDSEWVQLGSGLKGGFAVALSRDGKRAFVGDHRGQSTGMNSGHVNVYAYSEMETDWVRVGNEISGKPGEMFGMSVSVSADGARFISSAPAHTSSSSQQYIGVTRLFDLC